ncbi:crotonase/enoyl-CoA hydratase family protein [Neoroseomonas lacus]|uniref:Enoyl-CoA hydratase n=1 Tax=Neoroseomonas lacus TaxID=287609 RepID=A0A917KYQ8_9PROT|nr:crotonase/enoyl-CoA hydratase family protein [Neoroseomonas lacus]GGJ31489.1 enoyl-CoA hydratase [Neoroseomonas lacus]
MTAFLKIERDGHVVTLTLNRPEKRNAISNAAECAEVADACRALNRDADVRVVIVTGAGSSFCAGGDLKGMRDKTGITQGETGAEIRESYRFGIQMIPLALYEMDIPTIAAINGPAIGAGLDLACMCDIRIASETARFAESFVKVGIVPGDGGAYLLPKVVGMSKALEMSLTGDAINPAEALACGLVSKVVAPEELLNAAREMAGRIAVNPPQAVRLTKRLLRESQHMRLSTLLEMSAAYQALAHGTRDHREAVDSMLEKRAPSFEGR